MTYSKNRIEAYKKLEEAVENLRRVCNDEEEGQWGIEVQNQVMTGYIVITSSMEFVTPDPNDPYADDLDARTINITYPRRGQDPTMTYGMLCEAVRRFESANIEHECSCDRDDSEDE